jgi:hypothetical protein
VCRFYYLLAYGRIIGPERSRGQAAPGSAQASDEPGMVIIGWGVLLGFFFLQAAAPDNPVCKLELTPREWKRLWQDPTTRAAA